MPLGEKEGWETSESKFCGVETDFSDDVPSLISFNIDNGGFDFILAPLMNPSYRPSLVDRRSSETQALPFAGSGLAVSPAEWGILVLGKISSWIDLDSEDEVVRMDSEITLKQEIAWAKHLSLPACLLPTPKGVSCANYARCVNQILQGSNGMELWLRIPLRKSYAYPNDSWELWNSFRLLCDHDGKLSVALDIGSMLPSKISVERWFGEPLRAAIINTECFVSAPHCQPYMLSNYQGLITRFFHHTVQLEHLEFYLRKNQLTSPQDLGCIISALESVSESHNLLTQAGKARFI